MQRLTAFWAVLMMALGVEGAGPDAELFPVPPNLRPNVEFWKRIYTDVSLHQGLLHDRDYPLVVYETLAVGTRSGAALDRFTEPAKRRIAQTIVRIRTLDSTQWGPEEIRIDGLFRKHGAPGALDSAEHRIRFQLGQRERFKQGLERSGQYLDTMLSILRASDLPLQLVFLPHVESSFDPAACSKAGAAGLWQLMPATGKEVLAMNSLIDQRFDPILSTAAAARILARNFAKTGSWPLAVTAYNHGLGGVLRAISSVGSSDLGVLVERHQSGSFRFASKNFYSCYVAASEVASDPYRYFGPILLEPRRSFSSFILDYPMSPGQIAQTLGMSLDDFASLNPSIRSETWKSSRALMPGFELRGPGSLARESLARLVSAFATSEPAAARGAPAEYVVAAGETLSSIARRLGVTTGELVSHNDLTDPDRIAPGTRLRVPGGDVRTFDDVAPTRLSGPLALVWPMADDASLAGMLVDDRTLAADSIPVATMPLAQGLPARKQPTADPPGDSVTTPENSPAALQPAALSVAEDSAGYEFAISFVADGRAQITVLSHETLTHYAQWLETTPARIRSLNGRTRRSRIQAGQKLTIPLDRSKSEQFREARLAYHRALEQAFYEKFRVAEIRTRVLGHGENVWNIISELRIPYWLLRKLNPQLDPDNLFPGTPVQLPVLEPVS